MSHAKILKQTFLFFFKFWWCHYLKLLVTIYLCIVQRLNSSNHIPKIYHAIKRMLRTWALKDKKTTYVFLVEPDSDLTRDRLAATKQLFSQVIYSKWWQDFCTNSFFSGCYVLSFNVLNWCLFWADCRSTFSGMIFISSWEN